MFLSFISTLYIYTFFIMAEDAKPTASGGIFKTKQRNFDIEKVLERARKHNIIEKIIVRNDPIFNMKSFNQRNTEAPSVNIQMFSTKTQTTRKYPKTKNLFQTNTEKPTNSPFSE